MEHADGVLWCQGDHHFFGRGFEMLYEAFLDLCWFEVLSQLFSFAVLRLFVLEEVLPLLLLYPLKYGLGALHCFVDALLTHLLKMCTDLLIYIFRYEDVDILLKGPAHFLRWLAQPLHQARRHHI